MGKIITNGLAKRKNSSFFNHRIGRVIAKQRNIGNEEIQKDELIQILGRGRNKNEFNVKSISTDVHIHNVWCEQIELCDEIVVELEDNGQDFLFFHISPEGVITDTKPFQGSVWKYGQVPLHSLHYLEVGKSFPIHHPPHINFGFLKHKIKAIDYKF